jgi:hypothetical protein
MFSYFIDGLGVVSDGEEGSYHTEDAAKSLATAKA